MRDRDVFCSFFFKESRKDDVISSRAKIFDADGESRILAETPTESTADLVF